MQRLPKELIPPVQLTAAVVSYYTASGVIGDIASATVTNVTGTMRTVTVHLVPSGGSPDGTNIIVQARNVPANSSVQLWELIGQKVSDGASLQALASAASALNLAVGGYEVFS